MSGSGGTQQERRQCDHAAVEDGPPARVGKPNVQGGDHKPDRYADPPRYCCIAHRLPSATPSLAGSRNMDFAASQTSWALIFSNPTSGSAWRACDVLLSGSRRTMDFEPYGPLRAGSVGP